MTGPRRRAALAALCLLLALPAVARSQSTFANPVLPGDYPDPTIVDAGGTFYASATSSSWSPSFPVFRSRDLVSWQRVGSVLPTPPAWTNGNFWAPELVHWSGRFYAFYSASRKGGHPCLGLAVAARGEGPWTDKGPVLCKPGGTIDVDPVTNTDGTHWLVFKNMGVDNGISVIRFSDLRMRAVGHEYPLIAPDASWEQGVTEGPTMIQRNGIFYLFYAGGHCCRAPCSYAEGVAEAPSLFGRFVKDPANPILTGNDAFKCPGHGTTVDLGADGVFLLHHAYEIGDVLDGRRSALIDRIDFGADGTPVIAGGTGPVASGPAPLGSAAPPSPAGFKDGFDGTALADGWEWPYYQPPAVKLSRGIATLTCRGGNQAVSFFARQVPVNRFTASAIVVPGRPGGPAIGISAHGPGNLMRGIELRDGTVRAFRDGGGVLSFGPLAPAPTGPRPQLMISATPEGTVALYVSSDGHTFTQVDAGPAAAGNGPPTRVAVSCRGVGSAGVNLVRVVPRAG